MKFATLLAMEHYLASFLFFYHSWTVKLDFGFDT